jgi:hypothetical protein
MEVEPRGNVLQLYEIIRQSKIRTSMNRFVTNMTIDRVEGAYTVLPRTYMEITTLSMSGRDNCEQNVNSDVVMFVYEANCNFLLR